MKISALSFLIMLLPFYLIAQSDTVVLNKNYSNSDIMKKWYYNTYEAKSRTNRIYKKDNDPTDLKLNSHKTDMNFLYVHSYRYYYFSQMPYANGPVSNFYNQSGFYGANQSYPSIGSYFLASGINYVIDKALSGKSEK